MIFMAIFYDTHAHLDYPDYAKDLTEVIDRAQAAGITKIISIGTDLESSAARHQAGRTFRGRFCRRWLASVKRPRRTGRYSPTAARTGETSESRRHR